MNLKTLCAILMGIAGLIGALSSAAFGALEVARITSIGSVLLNNSAAVPALLILGTLGFLLLGKHDTVSRIGLGLASLGALLAVVGIAGLALTAGENGWLYWTLGTLFHALGLLLYGQFAFLSGRTGQWGLAPVMVGALGSTVSVTSLALQWSGSKLIWLLVFGIGWAVLGVILVANAGESAEQMPTVIATRRTTSA